MSLFMAVAACGGDDDDDGGASTDPAQSSSVGADDTAATSASDTATSDAPAATEADGGGEGEGEGESFTIHLPHHMAPSTLDADCIQEFADEVTARSDGRISFEITPSGALGGEADVEQNVFEGVFEMSYMSNVLMGVWYEPANLVSLPWLFLTTDDAKTVYESEIFTEMKDGFLESKGARVLDYCAIAERAVATKSEIAQPSDFEGIKIRVPELPVFIETFETLGALPTPLPFPEVYEAMSSGIVDGVDADFSTFATLGFPEVADYFTRTGHQLTAQYLIINEEFFQSLPSDLQDVIVETSAEVVAGQAEERTTALAEEFAGQLRDSGSNVVDDLDKVPFREATAETRAELAAQYGVEEQLQAVEQLLGG
jgi:TRAP-type C4-dicarboxylate transport system substrate-binding protein